MLPEFNDLLEWLWQFSARWLQLNSCEQAARMACVAETTQDLAGSYACDLEKLSKQCQENAEFQFDFFNHSGRGPGHRINIQRSAAGHLCSIRGKTNSATEDTQAATNRHQKRRSEKRGAVSKSTATVGRRQNERRQLASHRFLYPSVATSLQSPPDVNVYSTVASAHNPENLEIFQEQMEQHGSQTQPVQETDDAWPQDALFDLSDALMQPQFLQQDRVITFEDTYFQTSNMGWS